MSINSGEFLGRGRDDSHRNSDVDAAWFAQHHTLGHRPNQASPGNHDHDGITSKPIKARWFDYDSQWLATTTNPTLGNGILTAKYAKLGYLTFYKIRLRIGSTSTMGTGALYYFRLPSEGYSDLFPVGTALVWDASANAYYYYHARILYAGSLDQPETLIVFQNDAGAYLSPTTPIIFAINDVIAIQGAYESVDA